mmetsp:Transcript_7891/g.20064  ORF Transcript_7891/g.20064 Transcript_7891/m.20064 type:complete len:96 (-) Transcript_7891:292-579(-)
MCGNLPAAGEKLRACARCKVIWYCSTKCQAAHTQNRLHGAGYVGGGDEGAGRRHQHEERRLSRINFIPCQTCTRASFARLGNTAARARSSPCRVA